MHRFGSSRVIDLQTILIVNLATRKGRTLRVFESLPA